MKSLLLILAVTSSLNAFAGGEGYADSADGAANQPTISQIPVGTEINLKSPRVIEYNTSGVIWKTGGRYVSLTRMPGAPKERLELTPGFKYVVKSTFGNSTISIAPLNGVGESFFLLCRARRIYVERGGWVPHRVGIDDNGAAHYIDVPYLPRAHDTEGPCTVSEMRLAGIEVGQFRTAQQ